MKRRMRLFELVLCGAMVAPVLCWSANPYVVLPDGRKVEGTEVRATRDGVIYLTTASGRVEYPKGTKVVMDQPADLVRGRELILKKQYAEAIPLLEKVTEEMRFLAWDEKARALLASAFAGQEEWKKAVDAYESLMADFPATRDDGAVRAGYLESLAGSGAMDKVAPLLESAIRKGSRAEAARAQMIRAKTRMASGDIEGATYDYMRTARFFREFKDLAGEAAFRSAECLEKLGDTDKAGEFYKQVVQLYPDSPFAAQAKAKAGVNP